MSLDQGGQLLRPWGGSQGCGQAAEPLSVCLVPFFFLNKLKSFLKYMDLKEREKHQFVVLLICALTRDQTRNLDVLG